MRRILDLIRTLRDIWADCYPKQHPRVHSPLEKAFATIAICSQLLSFSNLRPDKTAFRFFMDVYVSAWLLLLTLFVFRIVDEVYISTAIAAYRLYDLVSYRCFFLAVKSQEQSWKTQLLRRSILIVFVNFVEAVFAYAILYEYIGNIRNGSTTLTDPVSAIYFSLITMTTVGYGDFVPADTLSKLLVIFQVLTSLLLLVFIVPALISLFSTEASNLAADDK